MRAIQITNLDGPSEALSLVDLPEPDPGADRILIDTHAAGVSFPEVLQSRGMYQMKPELPFVPGSEVAGVVRFAPDGCGFAAGDRVCAFPVLGGFADCVASPPAATFLLPDSLDFRQGAGLILNYHTAWFALVTRGRLAPGERVLVHGAAGGVGTATLQVARGLGAETVAVVSTEEKAQVARAAGADHVLMSGEDWLAGAKALGRVDVVVDPVGGDRFTDSLRSLRRGGRLLVVGFTEGSIPQVRVNRLLLGNTAVLGAAWGEWAFGTPDYLGETAAEIDALIASGDVRPIVGASFPLERAADALALIDERGATGKVVLDVRS